MFGCGVGVQRRTMDCSECGESIRYSMLAADTVGGLKEELGDTQQSGHQAGEWANRLMSLSQLNESYS
jgi:hypothetical protein